MSNNACMLYVLNPKKTPTNNDRVTRVLHSEGNYEEKKHFYKILHIMLYDKKVHPSYIYMIFMTHSHTRSTKNQHA